MCDGKAFRYIHAAVGLATRNGVGDQMAFRVCLDGDFQNMDILVDMQRNAAYGVC